MRTQEPAAFPGETERKALPPQEPDSAAAAWETKPPAELNTDPLPSPTPANVEETARDALRLPQRISAAYLALLCTLFLWSFDGNGYTAITAVKQAAFYGLCGSYVLSLCASLAVLRGKSRLPKGVLAGRLRAALPLLLPVLGYLCWTLLSAALSPHGAAVWFGASRREGAVTIAAYCVSACLLMLFSAPGMGTLHALGLGVTGLGIVTLLQTAGGDPFDLYPGALDFYTANPTFAGTIGNVGFFGAFLCLAIPCLLGGLLHGVRRLQADGARAYLRLWLVLPLGLALYCLWRIDVLAAWVGLGAGLALALPALLRLSRQACVLWYAALAGLALGAVTALYFLDPGTGAAHELHALLHGQAEPGFDTGRFYIWREVASRTGERLLLGQGPDTMLLCKIPPFSRYDEALGRTVTAAIDTAHCEYLNVLFHQGIPALLCFLCAIGAALYDTLQRESGSPAAVILGAAVLCYAIEALFGISQPVTSPFFWAALGCAGSCGLQRK